MTPHRTLIDSATLARHVADPGWVIVDCRFSLAAPTAGAQAYAQGHIPGAHYAHLDHDLAGPVTAATGRHPLPDPLAFAERLGHWGIGPGTQVVAVDDSCGAMAARLWWMLRWLGHFEAAVLDGGMRKWMAENRPLSTELPAKNARRFEPRIDHRMWADTAAVARASSEHRGLIVDARAPERFQGLTEPIDPVAGHIPGAVNFPLEWNLDGGVFRSADQLRTAYESLIGDTPAESVLHMCGSGVTACLNILAMEYAGLPGSRLYAGSWSEWIRDAARPIETMAHG